MIIIDGKPLDLTKPLKGITFKQGGFIMQKKDGVVTIVKPKDKPETKAKLGA